MARTVSANTKKTTRRNKAGETVEEYQSRVDYNAQYAAANITEKIITRVPVGWRDRMSEYVKTESDGKYHSVNDMICQLIAAEIDDLVYPDPNRKDKLEELRIKREADKHSANVDE